MKAEIATVAFPGGLLYNGHKCEVEPMFLSFIVPVYNAETYLPECLDSLLRQDIPQGDYEIICVNDGSKDGSLSVLQDYQSRFPNIRIIDKENGGVTTARNAGLAAVKGEYIWFVDADDLILENSLEKLQNITRQTHCDRLPLGGYEFTDSLTEEERTLARQGQLPCNAPWYDAVVWRCLLRREFLAEHRLNFRYPDITHGEDGLFMYEVVIAGPKDAVTEDILYFYRIHSGSAETAQSLPQQQKKLRSYLRVTGILQDYYSRQQKNPFTADKLMTFLWFSLLTAASLPPRESRAARKEMKALGLFPFRQPVECTITRSYMTDRTDLIGKIYEMLYLHLHTRWGFAGMYLLRQLLRLKRKLLK